MIWGVYGVCGFCTQLMASGERCDCLPRQFSDSSSTNKKYFVTRIAYCVRNLCTDGMCRFCTQIKATWDRCDSPHKFIKDKLITVSPSPIKKKIAPQWSLFKWEIGVNVAYVDSGSLRRDDRDTNGYTRSEKVRQFSDSSSTNKKYFVTRIAYCVRNLCTDGMCRFCTQIKATWERCDCLHKFVKGQTDINLISLEIYCDPRNAYCVRNRCAGGADSVHSSWWREEKDLIVYTNS